MFHILVIFHKAVAQQCLNIKISFVKTIMCGFRMQLPGIPVTLSARTRSYLSLGFLLTFQQGSAWFSVMAFFYRVFPFPVNIMLGEARGSWGARHRGDPAARACPKPFSMDLSLDPAPVSVPVPLQAGSGGSLIQSQFDLPAYLALSSPMTTALCFHNASLGDGGEIRRIAARLLFSSFLCFYFFVVVVGGDLIQRDVISYWWLSGPLLFLLEQHMKSFLF